MDGLGLRRLFCNVRYVAPIPVYCRTDKAKLQFIALLCQAAEGLAERGIGQSKAECQRLVELAFDDFIVLVNRLENPKDIEKFIDLLCQAVAFSHESTAGHQYRVTRACLFIARKIAKSIQTKELEIAARLHDFGKIGWPQWMFSVPREEAQRLIPAHHFITYYFMAAIGHLSPAAEIVRTHHAYDGYPEECRPEEMSIESQILSAADYLDALRHSRVYQNGPSHQPEDALAKLAARQYQPNILQIIRDNLERF